jgi:hypothetical protein
MVPAHFAVPLMYGDETGLTKTDRTELKWFSDYVSEHFGFETLDLVEVSDETSCGLWGPEDLWTDQLVEMQFFVRVGFNTEADKSNLTAYDCNVDDFEPNDFDLEPEVLDEDEE